VLLEPFGITRYYTDGWGAYVRHVEAGKHTVGKANTQKNREQTHHLRRSDQAVGTSDDLFLQNEPHA
jgi:IS1 family transposase